MRVTGRTLTPLAAVRPDAQTMEEAENLVTRTDVKPWMRT
jgi:hypothetical protein